MNTDVLAPRQRAILEDPNRAFTNDCFRQFERQTGENSVTKALIS